MIADLATPLGTIEALRAAHAHVKIAVAAGEATPEVLKNADILGANAVLTNSLTEETILRRVGNLLR